MPDLVDQYFKSKSPTLNKQTVIGRELMQRILGKNEDLGSCVCEISGSPGTAKTATLLSICSTLMSRYPEDKFFWSNPYRSPFQFVKLNNDSWDILVQANSNIVFRDRTTGNPIDLTHQKFDGFDDLWNKCKNGRLSCIFFKDRNEWMSWVGYTLSKNLWCNFFLDELGEIAPAFSSGKLWKRIVTFANDLKECRKCHKNVFYASQNRTDIDFRVRNKLQITIMLPGAKAEGRLYQGAIDNLTKDPIGGNTAWIMSLGEFGLIKLDKIYKPVPSKNWEAVVLK